MNSVPYKYDYLNSVGGLESDILVHASDMIEQYLKRDMFRDIDDGDVISYSLMMGNGSLLPDWI